MPYFGEEWDENNFPLAYLITLRTYGTWLHGDPKGSVDTHNNLNKRGVPFRPPNPKLKSKMVNNMRSDAFRLNRTGKAIVEEAIIEVCDFRGYYLHALNARPTHAHVVVSAQVRPEPIANAFKSYSTRKLRERVLIDGDAKVWARGRSRRYLWKDKHVAGAVDYVLYCQGDTWLRRVV